MALPCLIGRISACGSKVQSFKNLNNVLLKPKNTVFFSRLPLHGSQSNQNFCGKICERVVTRQICFNEKTIRRLSVSAPRMAGHKDHDHSKIWNLERFLSALLVPLTPAALMIPSQQLDTVLALLIVMHTHFGLEAIIVDYIRPILFGNVAPKIGIGLLYVFSAVTLGGLLNLIYNDAGLANTIISIWKK